MPEPLWQPGDAAVGLYLHVPFCRSICTYCAFAKGEYEPALAEGWLEGLEREIAVREEATWSGRPLLDTIFLGGGTPSTLTPKQWRRLGILLRGGFEFQPGVEFTSEANPESLDVETASAMREVGVNRLSLGVQSLDPGELAALGRIHGVTEVEMAVATARAAGFDDLNLDLMYGLPGQTAERFAASLEGVLGLAPEHVSAYCLGLEPGTPLAEAVAAGRTATPEDDTARLHYDLLGERMQEAGFGLYEISNFARDGRACRHNLRYWRREDVLALGPSSHALLGGHRWVNPAPLERWKEAYRDAARAPRPGPVPTPQARFEWVFLHLRLAEGFVEDDFAACWGESFSEVYGTVSDRLVGLGLLERERGRVRLASSARFVSDGVFSEFAPES